MDSVESWSGKDRADENFPVGSVLIRPALRPHVHAYYAFARNADDIADSPSLTASDKIDRLNVMQAVLTGERGDGAPSALRLRSSLAETGVKEVYATDLLIAFRQDAVKTRYATWHELAEYCRFSAMPVGRYLLDLHHESAATHTGSDALCTSLQVLNHLQDCKADFSDMNRSYLPEAMLAAHGAAAADTRAPCLSPGLRATLDDLLAKCEALNATAASLAPACRSRGMRLEAAVIVALAVRLAARLRRSDPLAGRGETPPHRFSRRNPWRPSPPMTPLEADPADLAEVERIVRAAGTSFHRGMRILPADRRAAMYGIYAFCRIVDDIADDPGADPAARTAALDAWRGRIRAVYDGDATEPVTRILRAAIARYGLRVADFQAVIDGMQMDADTIIVAPSLAALDLYCDRVAAAVGRLSVRAFGDASPAADEVAQHLGRALQYTNILRGPARGRRARPPVSPRGMADRRRHAARRRRAGPSWFAERLRKDVGRRPYPFRAGQRRNGALQPGRHASRPRHVCRLPRHSRCAGPPRLAGSGPTARDHPVAQIAHPCRWAGLMATSHSRSRHGGSIRP